jgi:hypothetical protein
MIKHTKLSQMQKWEAAAYPVVKRVVDKHDPESLLKIGCPKDEYDPISRNITKAINREKGFGQVTRISESEISNIIALSFYISFHAWGSPVEYPKFFNKVALDLIEALRKKKLLCR